MKTNRNLIRHAVIVGLAGMTFTAAAQNTGKDWIVKSNSYTKILLNIDEKYSPEFGSMQGLTDKDTLISVPTLANALMKRREQLAALKELKKDELSESNINVKEDLAILINHAELDMRQSDFSFNHEVTYLNATNLILSGLQSLLDDQTSAERKQAAIVRLNEYAGIDKRYQSLVSILKEFTSKQMEKPNMIYPARQQMDIDLSRNPGLVEGIAALFKKYNLKDWQQSYAILKEQLVAYDSWVKTTVLPKARVDSRLPAEEYQLKLEGYGVDIAPAQLAKMARAAFTDLQKQMQPLAEQIARKYKLPYSDYRQVMGYLKKNQIIGDSILPLYQKHLIDIENIIKDQHLVSLPDRPAIIKIATAAESIQVPAPHMVPPPFLNNTGQRGVFVLPMNMPVEAGQKEDKYDDFTFEAASWTLIAHEARPGHELQYDKMVETGVSQARSLYALNATNVEGWGLYSEYIMRPFMPIEGQLVSLDYQSLRAARAFLDPGLQAGTITQKEAYDVLINDVCLSPAFAREEIERFTFKYPGQANSYFYGFTKMLALRNEAEQALGASFNALRFHDFILSQGLLPPNLLKEAVESEFLNLKKTK